LFLIQRGLSIDAGADGIFPVMAVVWYVVVSSILVVSQKVIKTPLSPSKELDFANVL